MEQLLPAPHLHQKAAVNSLRSAIFRLICWVRLICFGHDWVESPRYCPVRKTTGAFHHRLEQPWLRGHLLTEPFLRLGLNSLLWWLVVALSFVLLLAASFFGFFLHLSEFLLLFGRKDGLNLRSRSLVNLLHLFSLLILSQ